MSDAAPIALSASMPASGGQIPSQGAYHRPHLDTLTSTERTLQLPRPPDVAFEY